MLLPRVKIPQKFPVVGLKMIFFVIVSILRVHLFEVLNVS